MGTVQALKIGVFLSLFSFAFSSLDSLEAKARSGYEQRAYKASSRGGKPGGSAVRQTSRIQEDQKVRAKERDDALLETFKRRGGRLVGSNGSPLDLSDLTVRTFQVRRGESLSGLLSRMGVAKRQDRLSWLKAARPIGLSAGLKKGQTVKAYRSRSQNSPVLIEFVSKRPRFLALERDLPGLKDRLPNKPDAGSIVLRSVGLEVANSLPEDAVRVGLGKKIVSKLADIFSSRVDFFNDIEPGDSVKVIYEETRLPWKSQLRPAVGEILAAKIQVGGEEHIAIYFRNGKDQGDYYNENGEALVRPLLRYPLEFSNISSYFNYSRFHPVLRMRRPHFGIDFAAPAGTPVRAIGDGKVVFAGWNGSYGRFLKIQHGGVISSAYAHMKSIRPEIKVGSVVQKSQEIGTVGSTGLSTGAHLHFALFKNDRYVDPLAIHQGDVDEIPQENLALFEEAKNSLLAKLEAIPEL
jgi:murein DD-endopeptidase MepM/ murein hydrolase activator NlpD